MAKYVDDAPCRDYLKVSNTQSDQLIQRDRFKFAYDDWKFHNKLPLTLKVICSNGNVFTINPNKVQKFPYTSFKDFDTITIYYNQIKECNTLFSEHTLRDHLKNIVIGGVSYEFGAGQRQYSNSYNPISGVNIHNHFSFPLRVYSNRDATAVTLTPDDGMGAMGGSGAVYYYDNSHHGLRIGDKLFFGLVIGSRITHKFHVVMKDTHVSDIHVGVVDNTCSDASAKYDAQFCDADVTSTAFELNMISDNPDWPDNVEYNADRYQYVSMPYYYPVSPGVSHQIYRGK
ncbi:MAG TPA: hypothetical protein VLE02_01455 [Nitrosarchaeum sp.]|nr:hypothetical protein [Nitrosarchaeum sp.]